MATILKKIEGRSRNLREILQNTKYNIDYYQREYKWERQHIATLIEDLETKFLSTFDLESGRKAVQGYPHYFLGSFVSMTSFKRFT